MEEQVFTLDWDRAGKDAGGVQWPSGFVLASSATESVTYTKMDALLAAIPARCTLIVDPSHLRPKTATSKSCPWNKKEIGVFFDALLTKDVDVKAVPGRCAHHYSKRKDASGQWKEIPGHGAAARNIFNVLPQLVLRPYRTWDRKKFDRTELTYAIRACRTDIERSMDAAEEQARLVGGIIKRARQKAFETHPACVRVQAFVDGELLEPKWIALLHATFFGWGDYPGLKLPDKRLGKRFVTKKIWGWHAEGMPNEARSILYCDRRKNKEADTLCPTQQQMERVAARLCAVVNEEERACSMSCPGPAVLSKEAISSPSTQKLLW